MRLLANLNKLTAGTRTRSAFAQARHVLSPTSQRAKKTLAWTSARQEETCVQIRHECTAPSVEGRTVYARSPVTPRCAGCEQSDLRSFRDAACLLAEAPLVNPGAPSALRCSFSLPSCSH
eukprot:787006-Pleurochrysis_carterae.AAC.1